MDDITALPTEALPPTPPLDDMAAILQFVQRELNKPPKRPKLKLKELQNKARRVIDLWKPRNKRFQEEQALYEQRSPNDPIDKELDLATGNRHLPSHDREELVGEEVLLNDPFTGIEKVVSMLSGDEAAVEVPHPATDPSLVEDAQAVEDFLRWFRERCKAMWREGLNGPLARDEALYLALRGWLCARLMYNPNDPDFPFDFQLLDPMNVYPLPTTKGPKYTVVYYTDTKANAIEDLSFDEKAKKKLEKALQGLEDDETVEIYSYYDDWWHAIWVEGVATDGERVVVIKNEAHEYGFNPIIIQIAKGSPIRSTSNNRSNWVKRVGYSFLEANKRLYMAMNRLVSQLASQAARGANPPVAVYTDEAGLTQSREIDLGEGGVTPLLFDREKLDVIEVGAKPSDYSALIQIYNDRLNRGSMPAVVFGEGLTAPSGYAVQILSSSAKEILLPYVEALQAYRQRLNEMALQLFEKFSVEPLHLIVTDRQSGMRQSGKPFTPESVTKVGYYNEVRFRSVGPQDIVMLGQLAMQLFNANLIDYETALGERFLNMPNPRLIKKKVLAELAFKEPSIVREVLTPAALAEINPNMLPIYLEALQKAAMEQQMQTAAAAGAARANQLAQGNSSPNTSVPNGGVPDELSQNAGIPPELLNIMAALQRGGNGGQIGL